MKSKLFIMVFTLVTFFGFVSILNAAPISIDFEGFPNYTVIDDEYASLGLSFYQARILTENVSPVEGMDFSLLDHCFLANDPATYGYTGAIGMYSSTGIYELSFDFVRLYDSQNPDSNITVTAYDGLGGSQISQQVFTGLHIDSPDWVEGHADMVIPGGATFFTIADSGRDLGIDHLAMQPVPEPGTIVLFGFGLLALLGLKKRKAVI